jgi:hypothetical protein
MILSTSPINEPQYSHITTTFPPVLFRKLSLALVWHIMSEYSSDLLLVSIRNAEVSVEKVNMDGLLK